MKKGLKTLMVAGLIGTAGLGLMTGCESDDGKSTAYIEIENLDTTWIQNQAISIDGAKIKYYENKDDSTPEVVDLKANMITNFNSALVGENTMTITYNDVSLQVDYHIYSMDDFISIFNTAIENLRTAPTVHSYWRCPDDEVNAERQTENVKDGKLYTVWQDGEHINKMWTVKEGDKWFEYSQQSFNNNIVKKEDLTDDENFAGTIGDELVESVIGLDNVGILLELEGVNGYNIDFNNNEIVYTFTQEIGEKYVFHIKDNKFVEFEQFGLSSYYLTTISYDEADVEMPALPTVE